VQTDQETADAELIARYRAGDDSAASQLYERHHDAAVRFAGAIAGRSDADDLASEAFMRVLAAIRNGNGPNVAFRPYLITVVRNAHVNLVRRDTRYVWVEDYSSVEGKFATDDGAGLRMESSLLARAFSTLPERWQTVLWHTTIEQDSHAEVGGLLGISPSAVAALSYRAREGLRQAYLAAHLAETSDAACRSTREQLPGYIREQLGIRATSEVRAHLDDCAACAGVLADLRGVTSDLGAVLAPALLGTGAAATYLPGRSRTRRTRRPRRPRPPRSAIISGTVVAATAAAAVAAVAAAAVFTRPTNTAIEAEQRLPAVSRPDTSPDRATHQAPVTTDPPAAATLPSLQDIIDPASPVVPRSDPQPDSGPDGQPQNDREDPEPAPPTLLLPLPSVPALPAAVPDPLPPVDPDSEPEPGTTVDQQLASGASTVVGDAGIFDLDVSSPGIAPVVTIEITSPGSWNFSPHPAGADCTSTAAGTTPTTIVCTFADAFTGTLTLMLLDQSAGMSFTAAVTARATSIRTRPTTSSPRTSSADRRRGYRRR
jgi:RNA polymerase sigma factor (sigma-70 family)